MKKIILLIISCFAICGLLNAQTLNMQVGQVNYQFPADQAGVMNYAEGTTLTIMNKVFTLADVATMYVDESAVKDNTVAVAYNGQTVAITVAGNVAQYLTITTSGAHVNIEQSSELAEEITYTLSGSSEDGEFYMSGSYKATVELNGLTLTNAKPVTSGAAVHIQNGKRIKVKVLEGTSNTLVDAANGSQKGALYVKGHPEFSGKGTLTVTGNVKHAIKSGEYMTVKDATLVVKSAAGDGINCGQYFLMKSGVLDISGVEDDGIQCDIDDTEVGSTGETADHEDEDSGNIYLEGGQITINTAGIAAKGVKSEGDLIVKGGVIDITTTGKGKWDEEDVKTKAAACLGSDAKVVISGGTLTLTSTGAGGKGINCDAAFELSGGEVTIVTKGALYYHNGTTENTNYTGNTDNVNSDYYSSSKGVKADGAITISGGKISVATAGKNAEGIESKTSILISDGEVTVNSYDDGINVGGDGSDLIISGGYVYSRAMNNDGIDGNGNVYVKGGLVYAIGANSPEVAIDANSEEQKKLYVQGGTLIAVGGLESGAQISGGTCKQTTSFTAEAWYALYNGSELVAAFKTPTATTSSSGGGRPGGGPGGSGSKKLVVYTSSTPALKSGVTVSGGTTYFDGAANIGGTVSGGSSVTLSNYTSSGGPGGRP
ncbi:MAG: carbohydrate-binding domain-containing protein [Prevotella sp.]|nr:carbohydrate-binding domain-containing protein [Paludibacteraceae bacterium]MBP3574010.1 carbohydrate-binding domain-containing protein [Prevotella sp.]MBP3574776.1 carbohydrate-binding domain-containing protein [Prevotella sp.]